jgi:hypothetical protein
VGLDFTEIDGLTWNGWGIIGSTVCRDRIGTVWSLFHCKYCLDGKSGSSYKPTAKCLCIQVSTLDVAVPPIPTPQQTSAVADPFDGP